MNKKLIIPIAASIATIGVVAGVTYAFFSANVVENNKTETVIKTNELNITYTGGTEITASNMIPGDSFTKTFSVENTSNTPVDYNIYMESITNEFNEDLVYTLTDEVGNVIEETALPETKDGKAYLKTNINIDANSTKTYTLKVEYKYLDTPQNDYQGKSFNATLGIDTEQVEKKVRILNNKINTDIISENNSFKQKFSIVNDTSRMSSFELKLSDIVNTYSNKLSYSIKKGDNVVVSETQMPADDTVILNGTIKGNQTLEYEIEIFYSSIALNESEFKLLSSERFSANINVVILNSDIGGLKCKRADSLHVIGSKTFGNLGIRGTLASGDAFDCDVDGDGEYNSETERFYYVSDYYNPNSNEFEDDKVTLLYYNNTTLGVADNTTASFIPYDSTKENWHGPRDAVTNLPTKEQWSNVSLFNSKRQIRTQKATTSTSGGELPIFDYSLYSTRFLTAQEVNAACGITVGSYTSGELKKCTFMMENTKYSGNSTYGGWIETVYSSNGQYSLGVNGYTNKLDYFYSYRTNYCSARPAIEVLKTDIEI